MDNEFDAYLIGYIQDVIEAENEIIEKACEMAIAQEPWVGVLVVRDLEGRLLDAEPDESVPVGQIHEMRVCRSKEV